MAEPPWDTVGLFHGACRDTGAGNCATCNLCMVGGMNAPLVRVVPDKRRLAVLSRPDVNQLFAHHPEIEAGGYTYKVLPHEVYETSLLRRLGIPAINPMLQYYDWAGGKPFQVQRYTCDLLTMNERAYVLNDMGTGKTKAALWAWDWLRTIGMSKRLLVVAPLSTLRFVWQGEVFSTIRHRKCAILHGSRADRLKALEDPENDILVINHDGIKVIWEELLAAVTRGEIDTMVIDELAVYRTPGTDRSKRMRKLAKLAKFVWGMTGSPMPTSPTDVWSQASIVTPTTVPKFFSHVRDQLMERKNAYLWVPKAGAVEQAFKYMQPAVRYSLDDVVELPEIIERNIDVALTPEQKRVYDGVVRHCAALVQNKQINAANAAVAMGKLLQIAGGWVYTDGKEVASLDAKPRIKALVDTIIGCSRKVIVFSTYVHSLNGISKALTTEGIAHAVVHGGTPQGQRDDTFNKFQNGPVAATITTPGSFKVLLAHPRCMAHGLTLTAADTIIWFLPTMSLEIYEQANARIRRVGQKHKQQIIHLVAAPVEKKIYSMLRSRQKVQDKFLGLFENATQLLAQ